MKVLHVRSWHTSRSVALLVAGSLGLAAADASAQEGEGGPASSYRDATARMLHEAAMTERERFDEAVVRYTAVVRQRIGASLRLPLKDRTLYRAEASHRVWWSRDAENLVQVLGFREQSPAGVNVDGLDLGRFDSFDPMNDRLFFGLASRDEDMGDPDDDFWFEHPLYPEWTESYWISTGDTLALSLPDGREVLSVELRIVPREANVHRMTGSLWVEPRSGSLVRAVYRLSDTFDAFRDIPDLQEEEDEDLSFIPGMFKPWTAEITMIAVDYALWDFEVWMPRSMWMDGVVSAGILKAPVTLDYSYELESVATEQSLEEDGEPELPEVRFRTRSEAMAYLNELAFGESVPMDVRVRNVNSGRTRYLVPDDPDFLTGSPLLPPPIWEEAPGFASEAELRDRFDDLARLPTGALPQVPATLRWGLQRPDLLRYNRVEALSVGVRGQLRPSTSLGPLSLTGTARLGVGDLEPNVRLEAARETLRRRITLNAYHELVSIDEDARHLGLGNSLTAALFGRDDGDYYRRSGASVGWTPPSALRRTFRLRAYAEYQRPAANETDFALFRFWKDDFSYRPDLPAVEGWEYGARLDVQPWWGTDPYLVQGGLDWSLQGGTGASEYARTSLTASLVVPLPAELRVAFVAGGGTSWGTPGPQRLWYVGGARTLRGYEPLIAGGTSFARGRVELARTFTWGSLLGFSDYGWAGDRRAFSLDDGFYSVGAGLSVIDGLVRIDGGYGLRDPRGFRLDFYLDGVL